MKKNIYICVYIHIRTFPTDPKSIGRIDGRNKPRN